MQSLLLPASVLRHTPPRLPRLRAPHTRPPGSLTFPLLASAPSRRILALSGRPPPFRALNSSALSATAVPFSGDDSERAMLAQVAKRLENMSRYFKRLGSLGFWGQLVCTTVSAVILAFTSVITGKITSPATFYATAAGIAAAFVSVFWSFGYIRLSERLRRNASEPAKTSFNKSTVLQNPYVVWAYEPRHLTNPAVIIRRIWRLQILRVNDADTHVFWSCRFPSFHPLHAGRAGRSHLLPSIPSMQVAGRTSSSHRASRRSWRSQVLQVLHTVQVAGRAGHSHLLTFIPSMQVVHAIHIFFLPSPPCSSCSTTGDRLSEDYGHFSMSLPLPSNSIPQQIQKTFS